MSRSPFAYPLNRSIEGDAGGAADLQTDIMRFMAILALCLMAIFALVQSIPLAPQPVPETPVMHVQPEPLPAPVPEPAEEMRVMKLEPETRAVVLTRPVRTTERPEPTPAPPEATPLQATPPAEEGFTLRFESDQALMRLVAASQVGFYAIADQRAMRMTVSESRISFWDASTPNSFHEMESNTVPAAVVTALERSGTASNGVAWGVTLPGKLRTQLDELMHSSTGGALVIGADGNLRLEKT